MANNKEFKARVLMKNDLTENWDKAENFIPKPGEEIIYNDDPRKLKIGDGVTPVSELDFLVEEKFTIDEKNKLAQIAAGAEVNVQSDWNQTNINENDYIKNKPPVFAGESENSLVSNTKSNRASADYSFAEGDSTVASGYCAHAEGCETEAFGESAHAEGCGTVASGDCAHAEGDMTVASNYCAHAEGYLTKASGYCAHAEGYATEASGFSAHAGGQGAKAQGANSFAHGENVSADADCQVVFGKNSVKDLNAKLIIGDGETARDQHNAFTVYSNSIKIGDTTLTESDLIKILSFINALEVTE